MRSGIAVMVVSGAVAKRMGRSGKKVCVSDEIAKGWCKLEPVRLVVLAYILSA